MDGCRAGESGRGGHERNPLVWLRFYRLKSSRVFCFKFSTEKETRSTFEQVETLVYDTNVNGRTFLFIIHIYIKKNKK